MSAAYSFRPATRENVGLLIGLAGGTGSGKTFTAFRLAAGIAGTKRFAVIDTEARRALHYADRFEFDHCELKPPFRPKAYEDAIVAADDAGYPVIVVDSTSHVWAGTGGVLDWQDEILDEKVTRALKRKGEDRAEWQLRESFKMSAWIEPKMAHKHMVQRLLQVRAHLILCFRAEEKVEMVKKDGKMQILPKQSLVGLNGWIPICEKNLPFELTASFLLTADAPGIPKPIKLQEQHRALFPLDKPITEESGRQLAEWAAGGSPKAETTQTPGPARTGPASSPGLPSASSAATSDSLSKISETLGYASETLKKRFTARLATTGVKDVKDLSAEEQDSALTWLKAQIDREAATT